MNWATIGPAREVAAQLRKAKFFFFYFETMDCTVLGYWAKINKVWALIILVHLFISFKIVRH